MRTSTFTFLLLFSFGFLFIPLELSSQTCSENNLSQNSNNSVSGHTNVGQSFTASCTGNIYSVTVVYNTLPTSGQNSNDRVLNIYDTSACGGALLHTQIIPVNSIVVGANTFILTAPVAITQGEINSWEISDSAQSSDAARGVSFNSGGNYASGQAWFSCSVLSSFDITFEVVIQTGPTVELGNDTTLCPGQSLVLDAGAQTSYIWSTGDTSQTISVDTAGTYWVTVSDTGANTATDSIHVSLHPSTVVNLGPDVNQCPGDTICLNAGSGGNSYSWSNGDTTAIICTVMPGTFWVTCTDSNACTDQDTIIVNAVPNPVVNLGPDQDICNVDTICLSSPGGNGTWLWSDNSTANMLCVTSAGNYWLAFTDSIGCTGTDSVEITANVLPTATIAACDTSLCPEISFLDGSTNANAWAWDFGDGSSSNLQNPSHIFTQNQSYSVILVAENNCGIDTTDKILNINCLVGLEETLATEIQIFPNPNQGSFQVALKGLNTKDFDLTLYSSSGQIIYQKSFLATGIDHLEDVNVNDLSEGIYLLRISADQSEYVQRIMIQGK